MPRRLTILLAAAILCGAASAQTTPAPGPGGAPTTVPPEKVDRNALAKQCDAQANKENLQAQARDDFLKQCNSVGGKGI